MEAPPGMELGAQSVVLLPKLHRAFLLAVLSQGAEHTLQGGIPQYSLRDPEGLRLASDWAGQTLLERNSTVNGIHWVIGGLYLLDRSQKPGDDAELFVQDCTREQILRLLKSVCSTDLKPIEQHSKRNFCNCVPSVLFLQHALQTLSLMGAPPFANRDRIKILTYLLSLEDSQKGCFYATANPWTRDLNIKHTTCVLNVLHQLHLKTSEHLANRDKIVEFLLDCQNSDGGFGCSPGNESHSGFTFCACSSLSRLESLSLLRAHGRLDRLVSFLQNRQTTDESSNLRCCFFNGRPDKPFDVCYAFWNIAAVHILDRFFQSTGSDYSVWRAVFGPSDQTACYMVHGILACQNTLTGGFLKIPRSEFKDIGAIDPDVFHTFYALSALSLLREYLGPADVDKFGLSPLAPVDPCSAFPLLLPNVEASQSTPSESSSRGPATGQGVQALMR